MVYGDAGRQDLQRDDRLHRFHGPDPGASGRTCGGVASGYRHCAGDLVLCDRKYHSGAFYPASDHADFQLAEADQTLPASGGKAGEKCHGQERADRKIRILGTGAFRGNPASRNRSLDGFPDCLPSGSQIQKGISGGASGHRDRYGHHVHRFL